eukprot:849175-Pyramimonas_sp.AAC.1
MLQEEIQKAESEAEAHYKRFVDGVEVRGRAAQMLIREIGQCVSSLGVFVKPQSRVDGDTKTRMQGYIDDLNTATTCLRAFGKTATVLAEMEASAAKVKQ